MRKLILLLTYVAITAIAAAQHYAEAGSQEIINYLPKEYHADMQNWAITQDKRGIMYFGNNVGLLEFDGNAWRLYQLPNKSTIRSLANGDDGKIYVGSVGDLGYFLPDSSGQLKFHSLTNFLPKDKRHFTDVWATYVSGGKVYFETFNYIFIWNIKKKEFHIIQAQNTFHVMFNVRGTIYVREWGKGLEVLKNDSLVVVKGGQKFANERIYVMLPFPGEKGTILIGTRTMGLFKYDGNNFIPFKTEADQFIKDNLIYFPGTVLSDGNILLGTQNSGAVVIDSTGREVGRYNLENGIENNSVDFSFQDRSGSIWLATANGISRIDYSSPVSYFDSRNDISGVPIDIIRHNGIIYTCTNNGLYALNPKTSKFHLLRNSNNQSWTFAEVGNQLLVGTNDGLFQVEKDQLSPIRKTIGNEYFVYALKQSRVNPDRVFAGTSSGLWSVVKTGSTWKDESHILDNPDEPTSIIEYKDGRVWMGTQSSGLFEVTFQKGDDGNILLQKPVIEHFNKLNGLQDGITYVTSINGVNYFTTADSIYLFNENKKIFYADTSNKIIAEFINIKANIVKISFQQDNLGRIWMGGEDKLTMGTLKPDGSWKWLSSPFNRFAEESISKVYAEKNGISWFTANDQIIKYDFTKKNSGKTNYAALIRKVDVGEDSTLYFGGMLDKPVSSKITYNNNSVAFRYAATSYEGKNVNQFKTFLEGFDKGWSAYSTETRKEYSNLPPGKYTFKVTALNVAGIESSTGTYSFEILPPWYRTWWAYSLYVILFGLLAFLIFRWQRSRVITRERQRAAFREANLKAEAENEQRKNTELISEMGKEITSSLSIGNIINTVYTHVNKLMDASVFGIGIVNREKQQLEFPATKEKGETLLPYSYHLNDTKRPASWCFNNQKEIIMNDFEKEHPAYISDIPESAAGDNTASVIYLPLVYKSKAIGVITAQSFSKNAYKEYHLNILRSLATYTALALDNADAYRSLKSTQAQLIQSEKMASLGELTAGIAHEIQNPLNFVNNFSEVNMELTDELKDELNRTNLSPEQKLPLEEIANDIKNNQEKISFHGKRADSIVKGMLQHSRSSTGVKEPTDINALADEYLRLSYHGLRAKDKSFNAEMKTDFDKSIGKINIIPQEIGRVLLNLYNNSFYAVNEKAKQQLNSYESVVSVSSKKMGGNVILTVKDNGNGIPQKVVDKIFQPFFTTKPTGEGTGLGLSLSYDIIKAHGGEIKVESKEGEGSEFIIQIPIYTDQ
ncbi:GAF domain-containing protein [Ginsengibacter hankyongi]|uniref:histidine kinase n=1 Tax=Ginsengibacter hankyongi TaxID=2607284 RepID=A0A5J5IK20_9BACT|nr:ATP-binding protein [Ginsengibacter hankyongi]KAA9041151.1 GAF domain-containing protein [Ginsengibacter hankyongi]